MTDRRSFLKLAGAGAVAPVPMIAVTEPAAEPVDLDFWFSIDDELVGSGPEYVWIREAPGSQRGKLYHNGRQVVIEDGKLRYSHKRNRLRRELIAAIRQC